MSKGPARAVAAGSGFSTGPAIAKMIMAAIARRKSSSHHGVCDAVSVLGRRPRMSRSGGNGTSSGRGGVMRSRKYNKWQARERREDKRKCESERNARHQRAAPRGRERSGAGSGIELHPQGKQGRGGGPVGPVHHQGPPARPRRGANGIAMKAEAADILFAKGFGLAHAQPRLRIDIDEFGMSRRTERSLRPDRRSSRDVRVAPRAETLSIMAEISAGSARKSPIRMAWAPRGRATAAGNSSGT